MNVLQFLRAHWFKVYGIWVILGILSTAVTLIVDGEECFEVVTPRRTLSLVWTRSELRTNYDEKTFPCGSDKDCGPNGYCDLEDYLCKCESQYVSIDRVCSYHQKSKLVAFLLSFFVG